MVLFKLLFNSYLKHGTWMCAWWLCAVQHSSICTWHFLPHVLSLLRLLQTFSALIFQLADLWPCRFCFRLLHILHRNEVRIWLVIYETDMQDANKCKECLSQEGWNCRERLSFGIAHPSDSW